MNESIIRISGIVMDKPYKEVLEFIKSKGLDYEELNDALNVEGETK